MRIRQTLLPSCWRSLLGSGDKGLERHRPLFHSVPRRHYQREALMREEQVLERLRQIKVRDIERDIVTLNFVKDLKIGDERVEFTLELPHLAFKEKSEWLRDAERRLKTLPWVQNVDVQFRAASPRYRSPSAPKNASKIANVIAVYSCKGGVGKSTTAVNLAYSLNQLGARVGLLDADVYGPSLPTMVKTKDSVRRSEKNSSFIYPIVNEGVRLMSFGFVNKGGPSGRGAAVLRGPVVSRVIDQLISGTVWGELDFLVVDMPPGTGDIQLTLSQQLAFTGAVVVTTPQKLSVDDVVKGIDMFTAVKVPTFAVVQNMGYFECEHGTRYYPFGKGYLHILEAEYGLKPNFNFPLIEPLTQCCDLGKPFVTVYPEHAVTKLYLELADKVVTESLRRQYSSSLPPTVTFSKGRGVVVRFFYEGGAEEFAIPARALRQSCHCAACVDEMSGDKLLDPSTVPTDVEPLRISLKGNYAVAIAWSDGHSSSIYPYDQLRKIAGHDHPHP